MAAYLYCLLFEIRTILLFADQIQKVTCQSSSLFCKWLSQTPPIIFTVTRFPPYCSSNFSSPHVSCHNKSYLTALPSSVRQTRHLGSACVRLSLPSVRFGRLMIMYARAPVVRGCLCVFVSARSGRRVCQDDDHDVCLCESLCVSVCL